MNDSRIRRSLPAAKGPAPTAAYGGAWLLAISRNSYAIYLAHPLILYLVESSLLSHLHAYSPIVSGSWRQHSRTGGVSAVWAAQLPSQGD